MRRFPADDCGALLAALAPLGEIWCETRGDPGVCVAVLDGPVDRSHPCLHGAYLSEVELIPGRPAVGNAAGGHGTRIASLIFGRHGGPACGLAPGCRGVLIPIYGPGPAAPASCSQGDLARALDLAVASGATVINVSGGQRVEAGAADPALARSVRGCADAGVLIVAAAGNDGCDCIHTPAGEPSVLAVGASSLDGRPLAFSNWGDGYLHNGILAIGEGLPVAEPGGLVSRSGGTSDAAAVVSGVAALLLSLLIRRGEPADPLRVRQVILETSTPCDPSAAPGGCRASLRGHLNLGAALARLAPRRRPARLPPAIASPPVARGGGTGPRGGPPSATPPGGSGLPGIVPLGTEVIPDLPANTESNMNQSAQHAASEGRVDESPADPPPSIIPPVEGGGEAPRGPAWEGAGGLGPPVGMRPTAPVGVSPSACGCSTGPAPAPGPGPVYALGQIGYDFGSEARRDSLLQQSGRNLLDPTTLVDYLGRDRFAAEAITWTLGLEGSTAYALRPAGAFAADGYARMVEFLRGQLEEGVERVSIPGVLSGSARLLNGQEVPVIAPELRGMFSWSTPALVREVLGDPGAGEGKRTADEAQAGAVANFLDRVYYEIRNLGIQPRDRAINYAATNAFELRFVYSDSLKDDLRLDRIDVERSPSSRPGSDCWDVNLTFFHPTRRQDVARRVYRLTVDVSDVLPVTIGKVRRWEVY
ncbi:PatA/PatG family cyanobactin maturation protease [Tautonia plasticadhaerens]|uniref:Thermophilic serine proteinase n=1 Tax=Tautonia plasticadhaerens TaxID=2527974 RepID=A0A518HDQ3_9BACT|nr:PatA/PatG family cyanobactin maturation protease [Tautonia plasticadhaerens]QDV38987.1 Thermophilic serine proteinase precursor [Tautonia plasticadhaerens]